MARLGLEKDIVDQGAVDRTIAHLKSKGIRLPKLAELADPTTIDSAIADKLVDIDPDEPHPLNLFRVNWFNDKDRRSRAEVPNHVVLGKDVTGIDTPILVVFGNRFPMIRAHKVLAAYGCLVPRLVTGQFDATHHRAIWPSTGNYCRGGVAISRVLGCRGVAVLPEGMSDERFAWLDSWVTDPSDVVRTFGTESNVKEIYDKCNELEKDPQNLIFNQFCEFGNHLTHFLCTGRAIEQAFLAAKQSNPSWNMAAFVSATGSAGTIAAGDYLKESQGARIVAAEALECPTMLYNGFGEHNIQGIGDKHIPFIHNVTNTDIAVAISDRATDSLNLVFNTPEGQAALRDRGIADDVIAALPDMGFSSICNVLSAIKTAKKLGLGEDDVIATIATDGAELYTSELDKTRAKYFASGFDQNVAAGVLSEHIDSLAAEDIEVLDRHGRDRIFNLGYFTWVEQQGVSLDEFEARRDQSFWRGLRPLLAAWDERIDAINDATGVAVP